MNNKQVLVGENDDLSLFTMDGDRSVCQVKEMVTSLLKIQNENVIFSACKGKLEKIKAIKDI